MQTAGCIRRESQQHLGRVQEHNTVCVARRASGAWLSGKLCKASVLHVCAGPGQQHVPRQGCGHLQAHACSAMDAR